MLTLLSQWMHFSAWLISNLLVHHVQQFFAWIYIVSYFTISNFISHKMLHSLSRRMPFSAWLISNLLVHHVQQFFAWIYIVSYFTISNFITHKMLHSLSWRMPFSAIFCMTYLRFISASCSAIFRMNLYR